MQRHTEELLNNRPHNHRRERLLTFGRTYRLAMCSLVLWLFSLLAPPKAEASFQINPVSAGEVAGVITGLVVVCVAVPVLIIYFVRERGVVHGCIAASDGKKTLVDPGKHTYLLADSSLSLPVGQRVKLRGHASGPKSARSFEVTGIMKVYGPCTP